MHPSTAPTSEMAQAELRGFARSIAEVEWLLLVLVTLYFYVTRPDLAHDYRVVGVLVGFAASVLVLRYGPLRVGAQLKIMLETVLMVAFLTLILAFAGLRANPLVNLYLLPIITASLALGRTASVAIVALVCGCYGLLIVLGSDPATLGKALVTDAIGILAPFMLVAFLTTLLVQNIHSARDRIRILSDRDELTGLLSMSAFARLAGLEHAAAQNAASAYALLMVDVDRLKAMNETYGYAAGNAALRLVAEALLRAVRDSDTVARFGGDEFVVCLSNVDRALAEEIAQRIRNVVFATTLAVNVRMVRLKVNVGVASFPRDGASLEALMARADRAMHEDKALREPPEGRRIAHRT
jgi:diguanylate cyclase (GGDEF)-like protein